MAKKQKKVVHRKDHEINTEQIVDRYTRILQVLSLLSVVILLILRGTVKEFDLPDYVIIGLMGLAVGLNPDQIRKIFTDIIKSFVGKK